MTPVTVRRLLPADVQPYRRVMLDAYAHHPEAFTSTAAERASLPLAWWQARLDPAPDANECVFGALDGAALVGVAGLRFETRVRTRHKANLFGMVVVAQQRRHGVGQALVQAVLAAARERPGVRLVQLTVSEGNAAAHALYARCGFVPFGLEPMAVSIDEGYLAKHHLWCDLRARERAA